MDPSRGRVKLARDHLRSMQNVVGFTDARVDLTGERVDLAGERVDLAGERVDLAGERLDPRGERLGFGEAMRGVPPGARAALRRTRGLPKVAARS